ncbi:type II toxin-antitoxin system Phd/YefM family antitoxin [Mycobacterium branderi]|uniref:type II toxin-antitoxin system Phd/YefM family antitoxin n=1 Tax=Mycobacterium branderi TaxID=43348 RepID=UPI003556521E
MEQVNDDRIPVEIISQRGNAVVMRADDHSAWVETAYLFRSPASARRLLEVEDAFQRGDLLKPDLDHGEQIPMACSSLGA